MRPYVERVYGWNDADQVRRFDEHFDPSKNRVVVFEGEDVGVLRTGEGAGEVWVANVQVLPEYQRRGIGAAVIGSVLADAHGRNLPVTLQVLKINPARALYERLGFRIRGETVTHYRMRADPP
jgi:ribosomal protein S18 acetylase RimI-like enzyme